MADQSKWSSSRVAHLRTAQQQPSSVRSAEAPAKGTQQSRWATTNNASSSSNSSTTSASSSWRPRPDKASTSSSSTWRGSSTPSGNTAVGSSGSRWACTTSRTDPFQDSSVSSLTDTLSRTSIASRPPSISVHSPPPTTIPTPPPSSTMPATNLPHRSLALPLGGKRLDRLALLASPSRGLDSTASLSTTLSSQGSMDLTLPTVQIELREYISTRIAKNLPLLSAVPALRVLDSDRYLPQGESQREKVGEGEEQVQQILLLVRKLREALVASRRVDGFAVEAYELSAYLAVLCGDATQLAATLPRLVLELYPATTTADSDSGDVERLASKLGIHHTREGQRLRIVALYLLQTLCLSGRATRLGQYSTGSEPLDRGCSEYRHLRATLSAVYGVALDPHLAMCDSVYAAVRDVDPFALSRLLADGRLDEWQRLIVLSIVPAVRNAAWGIARKAYMYLPVSSRFVGMIQNDAAKMEDGEAGEDGKYLIQLLLLGTDVLPDTTAKATPDQPPPDDWDVDDDFNADLIERTRLFHFLTSQFPTLTDRITPLKHGSAVKLR